jgi:hypothetical protein
MMHPPCLVHRSPPNDKIPCPVLDKVEPTFLVAKDGTGIKLQDKQRQPKTPSCRLPMDGRRRSNRGLRRLSLCGKTPSGRRIGIDVSVQEKEGHGNEQILKSDVKAMMKSPSRSSVAERLSTSQASLDPTSKTNLGNLLSFQTAARRWSDQKYLPSMMINALGRYSQSMRDIVKREKTTLIQAVFRGFLGRVKAKKLRLRMLLVQIQNEKWTQLEAIVSWKQKEMDLYHDKLLVLPARLQEAQWQKQSDLVAQLIPRVRTVREKHANLKRQLVSLKKDNRRLVLANSAALRLAAEEELRINRIERCGLKLQSLLNDYREALVEGRQRLSDLDDDVAMNVEGTPEEQSDRLGEIRLALANAKAADDLLLQQEV